MELMEEVFPPNSRLGGRSLWERRGSRYRRALAPAHTRFWTRPANTILRFRIQDGAGHPAHADPQKDPKDLNRKKVGKRSGQVANGAAVANARCCCRQAELCEALRSSVAALQREREALREEQRRHRALGATIESLVQERLKANEKEKYSMLVGEAAKRRCGGGAS